MASVTVNGISVHHQVHGEPGAPWVLNIGGSGGDLRQTLPERSPLNRSFRVLSYDQRGLGQTDKPDHVHEMSHYADDAAELVREVVGGPCGVVGTSFGGMVALHLALRHPDLVERMALLCTSPGGDHASYPLHTLADLDPDERFRVRMGLMDERWDPDADEPIPDLGPVYDVLVAQSAATPGADAERGARHQLDARSRHDVVDRLGEITCPTLVCAGRYDRTAPLENAELLAERIPDARLEVFEGGHLLMFQDRRVFPAVIDFLTPT